MTYKDVLVHIDESRRAGDRLDFAINFARKFDAHLHAIYVSYFPFIPFVADAESSAQIVEAQMERGKEQKARSRAVFDQRVAAAGIPVDWHESDGDAVDSITAHARHADITILGQSNPDDPNAASPRDLPELVALTAGRPVLVLPYAGAYPRIGGRVLVAWNASREAARAVADALPLLEHAQHVTVFGVTEDRDTPKPDGDITTYLAHHGVKAEAAHTVASDEAVGDIILSRAADDGADLIVMGCYGHSRLRELALGGASRHLFAHMTVPILASH
jgi:nucleotide-binding universal stress UspA family protein